MTTVAIIGGGACGLGIAWRAAQRGFAVTVADPSPADGAVHTATGILSPVPPACPEPRVSRLAVESLERYWAFAAELASMAGEPIGFRRTGTLHVGYDIADIALLEALQAVAHRAGVRTAQLTARACWELEPSLSRTIDGGLHVADGCVVDPHRLARALRRAAERLGVTITREPVSEIVRAPGHGRVTGIRLGPGKEISTDWVVVTGGWNSSAIRALPLPAPRAAARVHVLLLRTGPRAPLIQWPIRGLVHGRSVYLVPGRGGQLVLAAAEAGPGPDAAPAGWGTGELLRRAGAFVPAAAELEFTEAVAGVRPGIAGSTPVLGPSGVPGLVLATGQVGDSLELVPLIADVIGDYLVTECLPEVAKPFSATLRR